ncbi:MAG TPA: YCF48-related protein, partial [Vicinamibacterales bacterium]|nr:YCF48-related protein [Vicinamibacterales bacterium]
MALSPRGSNRRTAPPVAAALALLLCLLPAAAAGQPGEARERAVIAPLASTSLLLDAAVRDGRVVAVGERGHILVSTDEGRSWRQADVPSRALLTAVYIHDARLGWAVGHDEVVLRTRDGGATWERVHNAPENERPLLDVWFADARNGLAVGAYGALIATRDGGDTWTRGVVHGEDDFHLNQIAAAADGTLFLAGEAGRLFRSDDKGATWQPLPSPYEGSFFGLLPRTDGSLLAFGLRGHLFRSPDGGRSWTPIATGTEETLTCAFDLG